ncbi:hypothetical protein FACS1894180_7910 [Bacteroidia bacterium]|nr:hypothetical protein FACS1894180_7910 [Bacteroidia bacterium]
MAGKNRWNVLIVDQNQNTPDFINLLTARTNLGLNICGTFLKGATTDPAKRLYDFDFHTLKKVFKENDISMVYISLNGQLDTHTVDDIAQYVTSHSKRINFIPAVLYDSFSTMTMEYYNNFPIITYNRFPLDNRYNVIVKRIFDFVFSALAAVLVLSWLVPLVALVIKLDDGGKVFYTQKRIGFKGRRFKCLKFRSMRQSSTNDIVATQKEDKRITRVGAFLRKTSIDEFPQFLNVLIGQMSVVGPRPHMVSEDEYYKKHIRRYYLRHYVPPGITGLAQANGLRGSVGCMNDMIERIAADTYYVRKWSLMLDIYIIIKTFFRLFKKDEQAF